MSDISFDRTGQQEGETMMSGGRFHTKRWAGYFLLAGGIVLAATGMWLTFEAMDFLGSAARTDGTVIALKREYGAKGVAEDHPLVRFTVPETGDTVEFRSRFGLWPSPFAVGDAVEVAYDPADPSRADINSFWTIWLMPLLIAVFGLACVAAGFHTLRRIKNN